MPAARIVLASTSIYRKMLLEKLAFNFETGSPDIDESPLENESPVQLVKRLSYEKAKALSSEFPNALIIGSDQVACINEEILGKPGNYENAMNQLLKASGKSVVFYTGLTLWNSTTGKAQTICEPFYVHFRKLNENQIGRYLKHEEPYNCAGSFKSEGFGISLFEKLEGDDPNSLIGLPLIQLIKMLDNEGVCIP
jgi:septum formation protein